MKRYLSFLMIFMFLGCTASIEREGKTDTNIIIQARTDLGLSVSSFTSSRYSLEPEDRTTLSLIVVNGGPMKAENVTAILYNYGTSLVLDDASPEKVDLTGKEVRDDSSIEDLVVESGEPANFLWELEADAGKILVTTSYIPKTTVCYAYKTFGTHEIFITNQEWNDEIPTLSSNVTRAPMVVALDARAPIRGDETGERIKISLSKEPTISGFFTDGTGAVQGNKSYVKSLVVRVQNTPPHGEQEGIIGFKGTCISGACGDACDENNPGSGIGNEVGNETCPFFPEKHDAITIDTGDFTCIKEANNWEWECHIDNPNNLYLVHGNNRDFVLGINTNVPEEDFQNTVRIRTEVTYKHCIGAEIDQDITINVKERR